MADGWPLPFFGVDRGVLLWGSLCHHVKREASRFIPSILGSVGSSDLTYVAGWRYRDGAGLTSFCESPS